MHKLVRLRQKVKALKGPCALRTPVIEGFAPDPLKVGKQFMFIGNGLEVADSIRVILTSPVTSVEECGNVTRFETGNSVYELWRFGRG